MMGDGCSREFEQLLLEENQSRPFAKPSTPCLLDITRRPVNFNGLILPPLVQLAKHRG